MRYGDDRDKAAYQRYADLAAVLALFAVVATAYAVIAIYTATPTPKFRSNAVPSQTVK